MRPDTRRGYFEARVRFMATEVAAGLRSHDCPELAYCRKRAAHYATNTERGPQ